MSDQEPVNIMGVVAFPNPDKDKRRIRFIDSSYHELFSVSDGGNIVLTRADGSRTTLACTYIDDYHAQIGNRVFHICEFAEMMERGGGVCKPAERQKKHTAPKKGRGEAR